MVLVIATVLGAIAIGYARGGRLSNLGQVDLHHGWLVMVSVVLQAALTVLSARTDLSAGQSTPLLLASHGALLVFVVLNRMLPGMFLVFLGFAMNAVVITVNGAMPVSPEALAAVSDGAATAIAPGKHRLLQDGDLLTPLADIFAMPMLRTVVSVGDMVLAAGVGILVVNLMLHAPRRPGRRAREPAAREER